MGVFDDFTAMVKAAPGAPAVMDMTGAIDSYAEMATHVEEMARDFEGLGATSASIVALDLKPGRLALAAALACFKIGAAFLPLPRTHPPSALNWMLRHAGSRLLLTDTRSAQQQINGVEYVRQTVLGGNLFTIEGVDQSNLPGNAAYVIYTSGSSGRPKGVVVAIPAIENYLDHVRTNYSVGPGTISPLHGYLSSDMVMTTLLGPICSGGAVCINEQVDSIVFLSNFLRQTVKTGSVKVTPTHLRILGGLGTDDVKAHLDTLIIGGESLRWTDLPDWAWRAHRIVNEYGPTEGTVGCTTYAVHRSDLSSTGVSIPIGKPINGCFTRLEEIQNDGVTELLIGGACIDTRYLGDPEQDDHSYETDSHGIRWYRTGDIVVQLDNGNLQYIGRRDNQVKILGFRVDLGEIEAALRSNPGVSEAAVVAQSSREAAVESNLIAYIVANDCFTSKGMWETMRSMLPKHLLPDAVYKVSSIPQTESGKSARDAMYDLPVQQIFERTQNDVAIANSANSDANIKEDQILVWLLNETRNTLDLEALYPEDNLADLGASSLGVAKLAATVFRAYGINLDIFDILTAPDMQSIARLISRVSSEQQEFRR